MIEDFKAFQEKVKEDKNLQEKILKITKASTEETIFDNYISFAAEQGYTLTKEDIQTSLEDYKSDLSDEELEKVSGGSLTTIDIALVVTLLSVISYKF